MLGGFQPLFHNSTAVRLLLEDLLLYYYLLKGRGLYPLPSPKAFWEVNPVVFVRLFRDVAF